jgi:hypothetical protein
LVVYVSGLLPDNGSKTCYSSTEPPQRSIRALRGTHTSGGGVRWMWDDQTNGTNRFLMRRADWSSMSPACCQTEVLPNSHTVRRPHRCITVIAAFHRLRYRPPHRSRSRHRPLPAFSVSPCMHRIDTPLALASQPARPPMFGAAGDPLAVVSQAVVRHVRLQRVKKSITAMLCKVLRTSLRVPDGSYGPY